MPISRSIRRKDKQGGNIMPTICKGNLRTLQKMQFAESWEVLLRSRTWLLPGENLAELKEFTEEDRKVEGKLGDDPLSSSKENYIWISKDYSRPLGKLMKTSKVLQKRPFCSPAAGVKWHIKQLWLSVLCKCICCFIGLEIRIHVADTYSLEEDVKFENFTEWSDFMLFISIWKSHDVLAKTFQHK